MGKPLNANGKMQPEHIHMNMLRFLKTMLCLFFYVSFNHRKIQQTAYKAKTTEISAAVPGAEENTRLCIGGIQILCEIILLGTHREPHIMYTLYPITRT